MDFSKVEDFIRQHWPAALMVSFIVAPVVWSFAQMHFSERITLLELKVNGLNEQVKELNEQVEVLQQFAERSREKLEPSTSTFTADELYTPSPPVLPK